MRVTTYLWVLEYGYAVCGMCERRNCGWLREGWLGTGDAGLQGVNVWVWGVWSAVAVRSECSERLALPPLAHIQLAGTDWCVHEREYRQQCQH